MKLNRIINKKATRALTLENIRDKTILKSKRSQEEMLGFALIIVIVAVIIIVFLSFYLKQDDKGPLESYEAENFLQTMLHYTLEFEEEFIEIDDLIRECVNRDNGCDILENELTSILKKSWVVEQGSVIRGYELVLVSKDKEVLKVEKGEITSNYKSPSQDFSQEKEINFRIYY